MTHVLETFRRVIAENLRFALTALRAHKLRAFLTMVGIVIGVWTVISMVALVTGFDRSQTEAFSSFGTTLVQFQKFEPRFGPGHRSEEERKRRDLTIEDAQALLDLCPSILAVSPELVDRIIEEGTAVLRARRKVPFNAPNDFAIFTAEKMLAQMQAVTNAISGVMVLIAAIALLVGGVGVMNIMLVSVTERTKEIGLRKSVGALRRDISLQFLTEAMMLTALGGAVGVGLGLLTSLVVRNVSSLRTETPLWSILLGLGVSVSIGLFFGLYPALKAARLDPIEALRWE